MIIKEKIGTPEILGLSIGTLIGASKLYEKFSEFYNSTVGKAIGETVDSIFPQGSELEAWVDAGLEAGARGLGVGATVWGVSKIIQKIYVKNSQKEDEFREKFNNWYCQADVLIDAINYRQNFEVDEIQLEDHVINISQANQYENGSQILYDKFDKLKEDYGNDKNKVEIFEEMERKKVEIFHAMEKFYGVEK